MTQVTTFYSYKGGSGRSMSMANVAWALATNGRRVLTIDWDLEAPGLHRYFHPFLADPEQERTKGLIDRIWEYVELVSEEASSEVTDSDLSSALERLNDCASLVQPLEMPFQGKGCLHFIGAGKQDQTYSEKVRGLDWQYFYDTFGGQTFISELIDGAREHYDHILIDSRTGVADTAGICTVQLPDHVVLCFVYNRQSIEGTAAIAKSIRASNEQAGEGEATFTFLPSRVEERASVDAARKFAAARFADLLPGNIISIEQTLRRNEIRHYPWCAFEEKLAVFEDTPEERGSLLDMMNELANKVAPTEKPLVIANIDRDLLKAIWRKASFQDPRLTDLQSLKEEAVETSFDRLLNWSAETIDDDTASPDWLMSLAEAIFDVIDATDDRIPRHMTDFLGYCAHQFGERAYKAAPKEFRSAYVVVLQSRARQLSKAQEFEYALTLLSEAISLVESQKDFLSRWRFAGLLGRRAEVIEASEGLPKAIAAYKASASVYNSFGPGGTSLRFGSAVIRANRILSEKLLSLGSVFEANMTAEHALELLRTPGLNAPAVFPSEALKVIAARADAAVASFATDPEFVFSDLRAFVNELFTAPLRDAAMQRIAVAEARMQLRHWGPQAALRTLFRSLSEGSPAPEMLRFTAQLLAAMQDEGFDVPSEIAAANVEYSLSEEIMRRVMEVQHLSRQGTADTRPSLSQLAQDVGINTQFEGRFGEFSTTAKHMQTNPLLFGHTFNLPNSSDE
jgi:MinD-like ATPase involved in chromosome partitioning or flagellar assembly